MHIQNSNYMIIVSLVLIIYIQIIFYYMVPLYYLKRESKKANVQSMQFLDVRLIILIF